MRFAGTESYVATDDLTLAVNAAVTLQRPLLVKGEPGTGKTRLAQEVALALKRPYYEWHIKSTIKAQQGLYEYDAVSRLRDSQLGEEKVKDIGNYIVKGRLWECFESETQPVHLIDEIDKADIEFPNDLLRELDQMAFYVYETRQTISARHRPIIIITSNNEKELPDAFLRRCFFHYIRFPDRDTMQKIVDVHFPTRSEEEPAERGDGGVLRPARPARPQEEAFDFRAAGPGSSCCWPRTSILPCCARRKRQEILAAAVRCAPAQERAGCASVRSASRSRPAASTDPSFSLPSRARERGWGEGAFDVPLPCAAGRTR